jgi:hypothetical protein
VHSLHPLWDEESLDSLPQGAHDPDRVLDAGHEVIMTSELDGEPERRLAMPEDSPVPLVTVVGMTIGVLALLFGWYVVACIGGALTIAGIAYWLWPFAGPVQALNTPVPHPERVS